MSYSVAVFYPSHTQSNPQSPVVFKCHDCDEEVPAIDIDKHALKHGADSMRTFTSAWAYEEWKKDA